MLKRIFSFLLLFTFYLLLSTSNVRAEGEFSSSYAISYDVQSDGTTAVSEKITLKNLTDRYYASSFSLTIGSNTLTNITATAGNADLVVESQKEGSKTHINVKFNEQIVGIDKTYTFTLRFNSRDFAEAQGKVWQVTVPKLASTSNLEDYSLSLSVPVAFGEPTGILPEPNAQSERGGRLIYNYTKDQLVDSGIIANFGTEQIFDFNLTYGLTNESVLPAIARLPLPPTTNYQNVLYTDISPKPEKVVVDEDGNYIASFKVDRKQKLDVKVSGQVQLLTNNDPTKKITPLSSEDQTIYTSSQKFWEKDSTVIKTTLEEVFKDRDPKTNREKAKLIHNYVANFLKYDESRIGESNFQRLGALTALNNPEEALCSEYTDLFIALSRAAGIPARSLAGYAYTSNQELRPLSFDSTILHAWPEYFDEARGWVMIDPTWQSTTGGVNYFDQLDLNHFVLAIRGVSSEEPYPADEVKVNFSQNEFKLNPAISMQIESPSEIFAGFPGKIKVKIMNTGNTAYPQSEFSIGSAKLGLKGPTSFITPVLPPMGSFEYEYDLGTLSLWSSFEDVVTAQYDNQKVQQKILIKPFFTYKYFAPTVVGIISFMGIIYAIILFIHHRHKGLRVNRV